MTEDDTAALLQGISARLDNIFNGSADPKRNGFVLFVFPFNGQPGRRTNYVSNCDRADVLAALKEVVARFEGQSKQSGRA